MSNRKDKHSFFEDVYEVVKLIPHGRVTSYGAIAKYLGAAKSARMVGYALNNPIVHIEQVPAHRVVNRNGELTGRHHFPADAPMEAQLQAEGILIEDFRVKEFEQLFWDPMIELRL